MWWPMLTYSSRQKARYYDRNMAAYHLVPLLPLHFDCRPVGRNAMHPRDRQLDSQIGHALCSQRTWTSRVNCSDKFLPGRSTVVTARIMRTLSVVLRADVLITHKIMCGLHANLLRNKSKSHSTDHPTPNLGCDFIYSNTGKQRGLMKWSSGSLQ